ncbi:MAG: cupin domain-containing protein [Fimbriimonadaceae bacterium]|nr:cupin domain-containing protein [Fimbriimonadaceae bacterium]
MKPEPIDLHAKLEMIHEHWAPKVVAEMNDYQFKLVKLQGEFVWHQHENTDEVFYVLHGLLEVRFRDRSVFVREGELFVVPKGVEHITRAEDECHVLIIEPRGVINTGAQKGDLTAPNDVWI